MVPGNGVFLGAFVNPEGLQRPPRSAFARAINALESQMRAAGGADRVLAMHLHFYGWRMLVNVAGDPSVADDFAKGRTPVLTWTCGDSLEAIAAGRDDAEIVAPVARAIAALRKPVMLRWFHEFNLNLSGGRANGQFARCFESADPRVQAEEFIAAWRHVHDVFVREGAANVSWVWNPDAGVKSVRRVDLMSFFPGTDYADWIGGDFYDRTGAGFTTATRPFYDMAHARCTNVPLIIAETAQQAASGLQPQYFSGMTSDLPSLFPQVKAVIYFDAPGLPPNDWRLSREGIRAFAKMASDPYFRAMPRAL
ncbi:MAG TPA: hypothetical protein VKT72_05315 [Candidatus Baltobacteraceae bacterium]|nr:hypothetical protein [Candidatus Baltobacteraceae bacterium]